MAQWTTFAPLHPPPNLASPNTVLDSIPVGTPVTAADVMSAHTAYQKYRRAADHCPNILVTNAELAQAELVNNITQAEYYGFGPSSSSPALAAIQTTLTTITATLNSIQADIRNLDRTSQINASNAKWSCTSILVNGVTLRENTVAFGVAAGVEYIPLISPVEQSGVGYIPLISPLAIVRPAAWDAATNSLQSAALDYPPPADFPANGFTRAAFDNLTGQNIDDILAFYNIQSAALVAGRRQRLREFLLSGR